MKCNPNNIWPVTKKLLLVVLLSISVLTASATDLKIIIQKQYLNIPVGRQARMKLIKINVGGKSLREFPVQLAEGTTDYWIYIDVTEFKGKAVTLSCPAKIKDIKRIYQDDKINGSDSLYKESYRPQFHFTVKRGWSNDINGLIYINGTYHMYWQAFPFGLSWNTGYMYWGHATSKDMLHWTEHAPALMLDSLGSPWSGSSVIDKNNDGGFGKNALVIYYTAYDLTSFKQVQCIAYSIDGGKTYHRYKGNPVLDSNWDVDSKDTRDPKVFYYEPTQTWVMVLFERDGLSIYNSKDMKSWKKQSHVQGLYECPDFFELPVDGNISNKKWVLHGGSADYMIGTFDGKTFTPETPKMRYAEGRSWGGDDMLYATNSFSNMPDGRRVQIAWGRAQHQGMPFTQMMLFPTEFSITTDDGKLKLVANPIKEIEKLDANTITWKNISAETADKKLADIKSGLLHVKADLKIEKGRRLMISYNGEELLNLPAAELNPNDNTLEILIDKTSSEIFVNHGRRYIVKNLKPSTNNTGLSFGDKDGLNIKLLTVSEVRSVWNN